MSVNRFGFVQFDSFESADAAIAAMDELQLTLNVNVFHIYMQCYIQIAVT